MNFDLLLHKIGQTHTSFQQQALRETNMSLTLRNWLIGYYIMEFEQKGEEYEKHGARLIENISTLLGIRGLSEENLRLCRQFYNFYPQILDIISHNTENLLPQNVVLFLHDEAHSAEKENSPIRQLSTEEQNGDTTPHPSGTKHVSDSNTVYYNKLIQHCSFNHFVELLKITDNAKRRFYELMILRTTPNVAELRRHINEQTYEKVGLSQETDNVLSELQQKIEPQHTTDIIQSDHFFDFMELVDARPAEEGKTRTTLDSQLQGFLLGLDSGFCYEASGKTIEGPNRQFTVDLVFYNWKLKCHVLLEIKKDACKQEYVQDLKSCLAYFTEKIEGLNDNPPIGILLCADGKEAKVEYVTAGLDEQIFKNKYMLELPSKKQIADFVDSTVIAR
ncbi:MAG TPA: PDDEXK nuclease domain-containing protein [Paludibacter sp.]|nr:PDDEXK nuclease domain-containing protein [Paludibacter sp.]